MPVASVLVLLEFFDGEPLCVSLEALGQARRLGSALGLSVYALAPMQSVSPQKREHLGPLLGYYGADTVFMLTADLAQAENELRFGPYARALLQTCDELPPKLFFAADTPAGRDILSRLAARLNGVFLCQGEAVCERAELRFFDGQGRLVLVREDAQRDPLLPRPMTSVFVTIPAGRHALSRGSQVASVRFMAALDGDGDSSERTPVSGTGFSEESLRPYGPNESLWVRLPAELNRSSVPPLFALHSDAHPDLQETVYTRIGIGNPCATQGDVHLALTAFEANGPDAALAAALAKPRQGDWTASLGSLPVDSDENGEEPVTTLARAWDGVDLSTGDTEPRAAAQPGEAEQLPEEQRGASQAAAPFPRNEEADDGMWDGESTPVETAAPVVELGEIVTQPIEISTETGPEGENALERADTSNVTDTPTAPAALAPFDGHQPSVAEPRQVVQVHNEKTGDKP